MAHIEIDEGNRYLGFTEALALVHAHTQAGVVESRPIEKCVGYVLAEDAVACVNSPTSDVSLKDGFAVRAADIEQASAEHLVTLKIIGSVFAGSRFEGTVSKDSAVKICSGSTVPAGADAVVPAELCEEKDRQVVVSASAESGQNVFHAGEDVKAGTTVLEKGRILLPGRLGLLAAAGIQTVRAYRKPEMVLIGTGDELVAPGRELKEGQLYASNLVNIGGWLSAFGISYKTSLARDNVKALKKKLLLSLPKADGILSSGGAWGSERDLIVRTLDELGWQRLFYHVRLGPGKGMAFGLWEGKPVFCLPGGPPSNEMAFLQLALPGVLRMAGYQGRPLITIPARLTQDIKRRHVKWTEFKKAKLSQNADGSYEVTPFVEVSRLKSMAEATCLICIPEGVESLRCGQVITVQLLAPALASAPGR